MKRALALITAACMATPALAWGPREQGILTGIAGLWVVQQLNRQPVVQPQPTWETGPIAVPQPMIVPQQPMIYAQPQVILQNTGIVCPPGLAAFFNQRIDRYGRPYFVFDGCR